MRSARELATLVANLNPKCLTIGAGMLAQMQHLAKLTLDELGPIWVYVGKGRVENVSLSKSEFIADKFEKGSELYEPGRVGYNVEIDYYVRSDAPEEIWNRFGRSKP